jgi:hypothetical protein
MSDSCTTDSGSRQPAERGCFGLEQGVTSSPVWMSIADEALSSPPVAFLTYAMICDWASQERRAGYDLDPRDIACVCGVGRDEILRIIDLLVRRGAVPSDPHFRAVMTSWATNVDWNLSSPGGEFADGSRKNVAAQAAKLPTAHALRQRRYRARQKARSAAASEQSPRAADDSASARDNAVAANGLRYFSLSTGKEAEAGHAAADTGQPPGVTRDATRDPIRDAVEPPPCTPPQTRGEERRGAPL